MEEPKQSIWNRNLNLVFVYVVIFLAGLVILTVMVNVINSKVEELNEGVYSQTNQNYNY